MVGIMKIFQKNEVIKNYPKKYKKEYTCVHDYYFIDSVGEVHGT